MAQKRGRGGLDHPLIYSLAHKLKNINLSIIARD